MALLAFGVAVAAAALIGALGAQHAAATYTNLRQPAWAPPPWLFGPAWTASYIMIALSGWLVWRRVGISTPLAVYGGQLVLNAAWTPLFFGAGWYGLAFVDIVLLWLAIGATVAVFWRITRPAALLLVPYWGWVTFAAALNYSIWRLTS